MVQYVQLILSYSCYVRLISIRSHSLGVTWKIFSPDLFHHLTATSGSNQDQEAQEGLKRKSQTSEKGSFYFLKWHPIIQSLFLWWVFEMCICPGEHLWIVLINTDFMQELSRLYTLVRQKWGRGRRGTDGFIPGSELQSHLNKINTFTSLLGI